MTSFDFDTDPRLDALLAAHLDALISIPDAANVLLRQAADPRSRDLMELAALLHMALTPVEPSPEFVERLYADFATNAPPALLARWRKLPPRYQTAAKVGGATLTAGLMLLAARRAWGMWSGQRARQRTASAVPESFSMRSA